MSYLVGSNKGGTIESAFRLSYSEHEVAGRLQDLLPKDVFSVTLPVSRQNKGWDLLVHSSKSGRAARIQVKSSRCFVEPNREKRGFSHVFWFNNFRSKLLGADFFVLFGVSPTLDRRIRTSARYSKHWEHKTLMFSRDELNRFLPPAAQKFFYIAFDEDHPDKMLCLNGRKQELASFSYDALRLTKRAGALKSFVTDGTVTPAQIHLSENTVAA